MHIFVGCWNPREPHAINDRVFFIYDFNVFIPNSTPGPCIFFFLNKNYLNSPNTINLPETIFLGMKFNRRFINAVFIMSLLASGYLVLAHPHNYGSRHICITAYIKIGLTVHSLLLMLIQPGYTYLSGWGCCATKLDKRLFSLYTFNDLKKIVNEI